MITITLADGQQKQFEQPLSVLELAQSISPGLAKSALAAIVDGAMVDLSYPLTQAHQVRIITDKNPEGLDVLRHSSAHLLAHAVKSLYPSAQITIGPVIEQGFYYDIAFERPFTPEDLVSIESKMRELANLNIPVVRHEWSRDQAIAYFEKLGEHYKVQIIQDIPAGETLSVYQQGDFADLCRGPHVPATGKLKVFKLTHIAGAYWRGDSKNEMLQRIYGTAFATQKELDDHLKWLEEAEKRDHRKIGKQLDLFHIQDEAPGMIFWHPKGWSIYQTLEQYMRRKFISHGYHEVRTPQIVDISLWQKSGHWEKFGDDMFSLQTEERHYAIKPMNCPCHVQIFRQGLKSYRDLPIRLAEFGSCHRNEASGALHGLFRIRNFTQDDAHIFCTEDQIAEETSRFIDFLFEVYSDFGFKDVSVKLSTRPEKRVGSDEIWDKAEQALADVLNSKKIDWQLMPGEGAFYGPKIEFVLRDCMGRYWTTGSVQLDFSMPVRLGAEYVAESGQRQVPVMLHRAIFGALERFMGMLLEHYAGLLPTWLAPTQAVVMNITDAQRDYAESIANNLTKHGFRAISDLRNEKVSYKIREHTLQRVPYMLIVGDKEMQAQTLSVRQRDGQDLGVLSIPKFLELLQMDVNSFGNTRGS